MEVKNDTKSSIVNEFRINYAEKVAPLFEEYEIVRQQKLGSLKCTLGIVLAANLVIFISCSSVISDISIVMPLYILVLLSSIWFSIFIVRKSTSDFCSEMKHKFMWKLLSVLAIIWKPKFELIPNNLLVDSELFAMYNRRTDDDVFSGVYKGVNFVVSESEMRYESGSGLRKNVKQIFDGVILTFDTNKMIQNKTMVVTRGDLYSGVFNWKTVFVSILPLLALVIILGIPRFVSDNDPSGFIIYGIFFIILLPFILLGSYRPSKMNEIKLEDTEFSKKYKSYSSDEIEGRYLLTTGFMERFKNLHTAFGSNNAKCLFFKDKVFFAISTSKNVFEIGSLFAPVNSPKQVDVFLNEILSIYDLIDYFKLDEKTGL